MKFKPQFHTALGEQLLASFKGALFWSGRVPSLSSLLVHRWSGCISSYIWFKEVEMIFDVSLSTGSVLQRSEDLFFSFADSYIWYQGRVEFRSAVAAAVISEELCRCLTEPEQSLRSCWALISIAPVKWPPWLYVMSQVCEHLFNML